MFPRNHYPSYMWYKFIITIIITSVNWRDHRLLKFPGVPGLVNVSAKWNLVPIHSNLYPFKDVPQKGLIDRIVSALDLEDCNLKQTPAPTEPLGRNLEGEPFNEIFNFASVVGMMLHLCNHTRSDIAFAVYQCARYTHNPTAKHGQYLLCIGWYLKGTREFGALLQPSTGLNSILQCYSDADFAGIFKVDHKEDPHCVKSRTGYIITLNNCSVSWGSKLQTATALSTMEAEYIALSISCREQLPLQHLLNEIELDVNLPFELTTPIYSSIWEDNEGALKLANMPLPRTTPHSKHFACKYHWIREHVSNTSSTPKDFVVKPIDTKDQITDIFTKGLAGPTFKKLRMDLLGW